MCMIGWSEDAARVHIGYVGDDFGPAVFLVAEIRCSSLLRGWAVSLSERPHLSTIVWMPSVCELYFLLLSAGALPGISL